MSLHELGESDLSRVSIAYDLSTLCHDPNESSRTPWVVNELNESQTQKVKDVYPLSNAQNSSTLCHEPNEESRTQRVVCNEMQIHSTAYTFEVDETCVRVCIYI